MGIVVLDSTPLSLATKRPGKDPDVVRVTQLLADCRKAGWEIAVPGICDYEVRRELLRVGAAKSIARLDALIVLDTYLPLTQLVLHRAGELWAQARQQGFMAASPSALDGDVLLVASASFLQPKTGLVVILTSNVSHLVQYAGGYPHLDIQNWRAFTP